MSFYVSSLDVVFDIVQQGNSPWNLNLGVATMMYKLSLPYTRRCHDFLWPSSDGSPHLSKPV